MNNTDMHYLNLLSQSFPTVADAAKEIINLEAIMNLPKGTEHFLADIHKAACQITGVRSTQRGVRQGFPAAVRAQEELQH